MKAVDGKITIKRKVSCVPGFVSELIPTPTIPPLNNFAEGFFLIIVFKQIYAKFFSLKKVEVNDLSCVCHPVSGNVHCFKGIVFVTALLKTQLGCVKNNSVRRKVNLTYGAPLKLLIKTKA